MRDRIAVVIPAFQEAGHVGSVVKSVMESGTADKCLVVNDGSRDGTGREASLEGADVITLPFNLGYGVALQTGVRCAYEEGYDYVVTMDADGQHRHEDISALLAKIREGKYPTALPERTKTKTIKCLTTSSPNPVCLGKQLFQGLPGRMINKCPIRIAYTHTHLCQPPAEHLIPPRTKRFQKSARLKKAPTLHQQIGGTAEVPSHHGLFLLQPPLGIIDLIGVFWSPQNENAHPRQPPSFHAHSNKHHTPLKFSGPQHSRRPRKATIRPMHGWLQDFWQNRN